MKSNNIEYLPAIDHLRAFAAILIVIYHGVHLLSFEARFGRPFSFEGWLTHDSLLARMIIEGHTAVSLFMVLSGFIFTLGCLDRSVSARHFLFNRLLRTYPLFLFILGVAIFSEPQRFNFPAFVQSILGFANLPGNLDIQPYTAMFWAISVEWHFYLMFPFILIGVNQSGIKAIAWLLALFVVVRWLAIDLGSDPVSITHTTILGRMDQFLLGILAAAIFKRRHGERFWDLLAPIGCVGVVVMLNLFHLRGGWPNALEWRWLWPLVEAVVWSTFLIGYLSISRFIPDQISKLLCLLGLISYSIYLIHFVVIHLAIRNDLMVSWFGNDAYYANALATTVVYILPITIAVSTLTYVTVEAPFLRRRMRYTGSLPERAS